MNPKRPISELIVLAQNDGWHRDPLGREIIAELVLRQRIERRPRQIIAGLAIALAASLGVCAWAFAQNAQLEARAAASLRTAELAEAGARDSVAAAKGEAEAQRGRAEATEAQVKTITEALKGQQAEVVQRFSEQVNNLREENARLRDEVARLRTLAGVPSKP